MTNIAVRVFSGKRPKIGPRLLRQEESQIANNCRMFSGELDAWRRPVDAATPTKAASGTVLSVFRMVLSGVDKWLNWLTDVNCVRGAVAGDTSERIYYTGAGEPRVSNLALATGGSDYPSAWYVLGVFPPQTAPSVAATGGAADDVTYSFVYTHLTQWGEESAPSPAGVFTAPSDATTWDLTGMETAPANSYTITAAAWSGGTLTLTVNATRGLRAGEYVTLTNLAPAALNASWAVASVTDGTHFTITMSDPGTITDQTGTASRDAPHNTTGLKTRIYVSLSGTVEAEYLFLAEITTAATYSAAIDPQDLGDVMEADNYDQPPTDMKGLIEMPNGMAVAFSKNEILFAEPFKWHAWPEGYRQALTRDVVGLGVFNDTVVAGTKAEPYSGSGSHPENIVMRRVEGMIEPCLSKRGIASTSFGVFYPSKNGLVLVGVGGALVATEEGANGLLDQDDWDAYAPSTLIGVGYRDRYFGWYESDDESQGFIFDRSGAGPSLVDLTYQADAVYLDRESGLLYFVNDGKIKQWSADEVNFLPYDWRSKVFVTPRPINLSCAQVLANFDSMEETDAITEQMVADAAFNALILAGTESWPGQGVTHGEFGGAMWGEYMWGGSALVGGLYAAIDNRSLLFRLYGDGDLVHTEQIVDGAAFRIPAGEKHRDWEVAISGNVEVYSVEVADAMSQLGLG